jgi:hypothetical protein
MAKSMSSLSVLRAALLGASALVLLQPSGVAARVGVTSATSGDPLGKPPTTAERVLRIGIDVQANEVVTTSANDRAHLVFLDGTSVTVGPNARLTIDRFVYDPATKTGELSLTAGQGVFRLVGGKISKSKPITVNTPSSTIGIRGGIIIFQVNSAQTVSTFVFGDRMTVSGQGQTQVATRPGSQITTNNGTPPGVPTLVPQGALANSIGQLEGQGQGGPGGTAADQGAQTFSSNNSGNPLTTVYPPPPPPPSNITNTIISDANAGQPPPPPPPATTTTTRVVVSQGRFLREQPFIPGTFNNQTLAVQRDPVNNQALKPQATVTDTTTTANGPSTTTSTITVVAADGTTTLVLPWLQGERFTFTGNTADGIGTVSPSGDFFLYVLTAKSDGKKFGVFGGTPTTTAQFPTSGPARHTMLNVGSNGNLPFAPDTIGGDQAIKNAATVSDLYSFFSNRLSHDTGTGNPNKAAVSFQATISITGTGVNQKSYMGGFIGDYFKDYQTNSYFNAGGFVGSYRGSGANNRIGRITSAISTAHTANGNAIYGPNADYMVFMTDAVGTSFNSQGGTTTRTSQLAFNQPFDNLQGTGYFTLNAAIKNTEPTGQNTRTDKTMKGFVGGLIEARVDNDYFTRPMANRDANDVSITTSATNNRAAGTIVLRDYFGTGSPDGPAATFELGGTTGPQGASSAFIDDKIYAMRDQRADPSRFTKLSLQGDSVPINSRTMLVSSGAAPLEGAGQFWQQQGVTPCTCEFLSWGWWSGDINYGNLLNDAVARERMNLNTYVVGTMSTLAQLNAQTGSATYTGHMVGNVNWGANNYVAAGSYTNNWNFGTMHGQVNASFDGLTLSGTAGLVQGGPGFSAPLAVTAASGTFTNAGSGLNGAFFSTGPGATGVNGAIGQAGNFTLLGTRAPTGGAATTYQAGGIFAGKRQP